MNFFGEIFNLILYRPLFNVLILFYQYLPGNDFGLAIILLTILVRLIFYPLMIQSIKNQKKISDIQPKFQEIQKKYKDNPEKKVQETMELYKKEKINPFSSFLPILIQLPILIALYQVFWKGLRPEEMSNLYSFISSPKTIDPTFLGMINLAYPSLVLAFLAGVFQYIQTKMTTAYQQKMEQGQNLKTKNLDFSHLLQKQMLYFFPIFTVLILMKLPAAIGLYWVVTSLFSIFQQNMVYKKNV